MKIVQYYVVLLFCNNLKKKKKRCLYFSNFRGEKHFCKAWENDFMLCTIGFNDIVLAYFIDEIKLR